MTSIPVFFSNGSQDTWQKVCHLALLKLFSITLRKQSPLWQLIHCWYICYSFTYDATPITKMWLCNRSSWCENILFSAKNSMIKVKRLYAFIQHLNHPPPTPQHPPPPQPASGRRRWRPWNKADLKYHVWSAVCNGVSKHFLHFLRPEVTIKNNTIIVIKDVHLPK